MIGFPMLQIMEDSASVDRRMNSDFDFGKGVCTSIGDNRLFLFQPQNHRSHILTHQTETLIP